MNGDRYRPPSDPAKDESSLSAYVDTELLIELLHFGSLDVVLARLGDLREVLLFRDQIAEVKHALRSDFAALRLFVALANQGIVFTDVPSDSVQNLNNYWKCTMVEKGGLEDLSKWPFIALWTALGIAERLFLIKIRRKAPHVLITNDPAHRYIAKYMEIECA